MPTMPPPLPNLLSNRPQRLIHLLMRLLQRNVSNPNPRREINLHNQQSNQQPKINLFKPIGLLLQHNHKPMRSMQRQLPLLHFRRRQLNLPNLQ